MEIKDFSKKSILVVGDIMLDQYAYYTSTGQSPEAPVPIIKENQNMENKLGGAANVAANLRDLKIKTSLAGVIGEDEDGKILTNLLDNITQIIFTDKSRPTTRKKRILASSKAHPPYQIVRIDNESTESTPEHIEQDIIYKLKNEIPKVDAVIFSDYSKGFLTNKIIKELTKTASEIPTIVDTKPSKIELYKGSTWFTPNIVETELITGIKYTSPQDKQTLENIGNLLFEKLSPKHILFTVGSDGAILYTSSNKFEYIPTQEIENADVAGAGDTINATLAASLAVGYSPLESAKIANYAASIVVQKRGTATCSLEELTEIIKK